MIIFAKFQDVYYVKLDMSHNKDKLSIFCPREQETEWETDKEKGREENMKSLSKEIKREHMSINYTEVSNC